MYAEHKDVKGETVTPKADTYCRGTGWSGAVRPPAPTDAVASEMVSLPQPAHLPPHPLLSLLVALDQQVLRFLLQTRGDQKTSMADPSSPFSLCR